MNAKQNQIVKVGMKVKYRGCFGSGPVTEATIEYIELCESEHEKYGEPVSEVSVKDLRRCCLDLSDGHWAYGYQVVGIIG